MGLYTNVSVDTYVHPILLFTDASLQLDRGNSNVRAYGTGHMVLMYDRVFTGWTPHVNTDVKQFTEHGLQKETLNLPILEMQAIIDGLNSPYIQVNDNVIVYTDSEIALKAYYGVGMKPITILKYAKMLKQIRKTKANKHLKLEIRWIKGHSKIFGNNEADILAKRASKKAFKLMGINQSVSDIT